MQYRRIGAGVPFKNGKLHAHIFLQIVQHCRPVSVLLGAGHLKSKYACTIFALCLKRLHHEGIKHQRAYRYTDQDGSRQHDCYDLTNLLSQTLAFFRLFRSLNPILCHFFPLHSILR